MSDFMKKPCEHCPYRHDVKPFLTAERGIDLAYHATNPFNYFHCHKTTEADENSEEGEMLVTNNSKLCAGFLTLQAIENDGCGFEDDGFETSYELVYSEAHDMASAYEEGGE